uniref:C2H2-type domain-containing protein n=1 Tax=Ditylenchus dipsaci TaxID=166011 RepID=A0A915CV22_9BILA
MSENSRTPSFGGPQNVVMNGTRMSSTPSSHSSADSIASRQSCSPTAEAISNLLLGGHQNTSNSQLIGNQQQQQHVSNATAMSSSNNHATVSQGGVLSAGAGNNNLLDFSVSQLYGGHFADQLDVSNLFQGMSSHINNSANSHLQQQNPASTNPNNNLEGQLQTIPVFNNNSTLTSTLLLLRQYLSPGGVTAALAAFGQQSQQQQQQTETQRLQHNSVNGGQSQQQQPAGAIRQRHRSSASDSMFKCNYCPKKYPSQAALQNHMDDCRNIRVHECSQCGKRFKARGGLQQHNRIHINDRPYHCHYCPKGLPRSPMWTNTNAFTQVLNHFLANFVEGHSDKEASKWAMKLLTLMAIPILMVV